MTTPAPATPHLDRLDARLIGELRRSPNTAEVTLARRLGVARNTVRSRLRKLTQSGAVTGFGPDVDARAIGYDVLAFVTISISQGSEESLLDTLAATPEVLEVHAVTGSGDLLCRVVARSNEHLYDLIQSIVDLPMVARSTTELALRTHVRRTEADLVAWGAH